MHILDNDIKEIEIFILSSVDKFMSENGRPSAIGIYCCPWAGWLTANFNIQKSIGDTGENCPDFEFVEFDVLDFDEWQEEYESEEPAFEILGAVTNHDHDSGNEALNKFFFEILQPIANAVKKKTQINVLLQLLDSNCVKTF